MGGGAVETSGPGAGGAVGMRDDGTVAADKQRGRQTARDMVLSLAVIVLAAGVIYLFIPHDEDQNPVKTVSYRVELDTARRAAPYPVAAPSGLPEEWRATSVRYGADEPEGSVWHLGFLTPDDEYIGLEQADAKRPGAYIQGVTQGAEKTAETVRAGGQKWQRYEGDAYDALVRTGGKGGSTTVVTGTASAEQLARFAGALDNGKAAGR